MEGESELYRQGRKEIFEVKMSGFDCGGGDINLHTMRWQGNTHTHTHTHTPLLHVNPVEVARSLWVVPTSTSCHQYFTTSCARQYYWGQLGRGMWDRPVLFLQFPVTL